LFLGSVFLQVLVIKGRL